MCLKEVIDTRLDLGYGRVSEALLQKSLSSRLNPPDARTLAEALKIKHQEPSAEVILLSLGPESVETYLREGLARGGDKAFRLWEEGFQYLSSYQKARLLSRAVLMLKADLVLTGASSLDIAAGLVGPLIAAWLDFPCVCEVTDFIAYLQTGTVTVTRKAGKSLREKLLVTLPVVLAVCAGEEDLPYAPLDKLLDSLHAEIPILTLSDLGITPWVLKKDPTLDRGLSFPRPRTRPAPLDSSLPAFYRILALLEGGQSKRRGEILQGDIDALVDRLFNLLVGERNGKTGLTARQQGTPDE